MALTKCLGDHNLPKQNNNLQRGSLEISLMRRDREINYSLILQSQLKAL